MKNLNEMTAKELKELAKELKVKNWWNKSKAQLIADIEAAQPIVEEVEEAVVVEEEVIINECELTTVVEPEVVAVEEVIEEVVSESQIADVKDRLNINEVEDDSQKVLEPKRGQVINYQGKSLALCAWARELGLPVQTLYGRLFNRKWTVEKAFTYDRKKKAE